MATVLTKLIHESRIDKNSFVNQNATSRSLFVTASLSCDIVVAAERSRWKLRRMILPARSSQEVAAQQLQPHLHPDINQRRLCSASFRWPKQPRGRSVPDVWELVVGPGLQTALKLLCMHSQTPGATNPLSRPLFSHRRSPQTSGPHNRHMWPCRISGTRMLHAIPQHPPCI